MCGQLGARGQRSRGAAYLELVLQQVLLVWQLAVQAEELGLLRRHFLCYVRFGLRRVARGAAMRAARELRRGRE